MAMEKPPHPGHSIVENWLDPLRLNVTDAARVLGVARHTLSRVLNGHAAVSPEMAIRLEKAGWSNAEYWLRRQTAYDLLQAREHEDRIQVERYRPQPPLREGHGVYRNTNIAVFLGAGTSEAAGFPSIQDLTDVVVSGRGVTRHGDGCFYISGEEVPKTAEVGLPLSMVKQLHKEAETYLSTRVNRTASYEDIYFLARQALDDELGETENPAIRLFVDRLKANWLSLSNKGMVRGEAEAFSRETGAPDDLGGLLWETCNYITDVVRRSLLLNRPEPDRIRQLSTVEHVCKAFNVTCLSTLCHDTHVEAILRDRNVALVDGFAGGLDGISPWDGDLISEEKIPFLKLRGSVDWYRYRDGKVRRVAPDLYPQRIEVNGAFLYAEDVPRMLLFGPFNKLSDYGTGIFRDLRHCFRLTIGNANTMVVCGYDFGDRGVNNELLDWYAAGEGRRFVIVHPEPDRLAENLHATLRIHWETWQKVGAVSIIEKRFEQIEAPEFVEAIAQHADQ